MCSVIDAWQGPIYGQKQPFRRVLTKMCFEKMQQNYRRSAISIKLLYTFTVQKMRFKDFFSKCDQIYSFLRIWSHLLKKSLMENITFCTVFIEIALQHGCSPVNLLHIFGTSFPKNNSGRLLLHSSLLKVRFTTRLRICLFKDNSHKY